MRAALMRAPAAGGWRYLQDRYRSWLTMARLLPRAGWPVVLSAVAISLAIGLLPLVFIVGTSVMLQRVPALAAPGHAPGAWAAVMLAFAMALGALVAQNALSPLQAAIAELVTRRIDGYCIRRLMTAVLTDAQLALLERQDILDKLSAARQGLLERFQTPGSAVAGLLAVIARYVQMIGAAVIVGVVLGPLAGLVLAAATAVMRVGSRGSLTRWSLAIRHGMLGPRRKMRYVLDMGSDPALAKEVRTYGILTWLRTRASTEARSFLTPWWRERRRIYFTPFLVFSAAILAGTFLVLLRLHAAAGGGISVLGLSLVIQGILLPIQMGTYFPESDLQTAIGTLAQQTITDLERIFRASPAQIARGGAPAAGLPRYAVRFEDVHFHYAGSDRMVLNGLDLELRAGTSTAIVGMNGAGKTTLVKLLARHYEPTAGRISVDGTDLLDLDSQGWQRQLAVIFQDYVRYEMDAAANIGMGAPGHLLDGPALRAAAERAGAAGIIASLPAGLATPLSSRYAGGVDLSGGQWQRIALARALLAVSAGSSVLVLDEPTAQLDVRAEVAFFDRFLELTRGLTAVVISHRFSTVRRADRIAVLEDGRVAETGTHDELIRTGGRYAELFWLQAHRFTAADPQPRGAR
jgi:ATP-binding cassette, subfamily B, bacterial